MKTICISNVGIFIISMHFSYIPALVQVQEPWQKMYLGCCAGKGTCVNLNMVHLRKVPSHCKYLTGIYLLYFNSI